MFKKFEGMDRWTLVSMKLATIAFVLVVLKIWNGASKWVYATNVWWFVLAFVAFAIGAGMGSGCCAGNKPVDKKVAGKKITKKKAKK
jgi:hypothetical protein